jgi:hypothetical protein
MCRMDSRSHVTVLGRRKSIPGSNACVRRVATDGHPGLARSMDSTPQCCGKNLRRFAILLRCKPGFTIHGEPACRMRRALFFTPRNKYAQPDGLHLDRIALRPARLAPPPAPLYARDQFSCDVKKERGPNTQSHANLFRPQCGRAATPRLSAVFYREKYADPY